MANSESFASVGIVRPRRLLVGDITRTKSLTIVEITVSVRIGDVERARLDSVIILGVGML